MKRWYLFYLYFLGLVCALRPVEDYKETLQIRRLDNDSIGYRFEFVLRKADNNNVQFEVFPKIITQVITENVLQLGLTLTRGRWVWGSETLWPSLESGSPGVEVWAKLKNVSSDWVPLIRGLAGMTCSSLDILQEKSNTVVFKDGVVFGSIPSETVCVENLSNWIKLLPCRNRAGLGSLISTKKAVNTQYYALAMSSRRTKLGIELILSITIVLGLKNSILSTIENQTPNAISKGCKLASSSSIYIETKNISKLSTKPNFQNDNVSVFHFPLASDIEGLNTMSVFESNNQLKTKRWSSGYGDRGGMLSTALYNLHPTNELHVRHLEIIPSFLKPKYGTLKIFLDETSMNSNLVNKMTKITPSFVRGYPALLEFDLILPPGGKRVLISFEYEKVFLFYAEFPPNPNRGFDVPSAFTFYNRTSSHSFDSNLGALLRSHSGTVKFATDALLVKLPHPDFSMPYNVITLSSTGFALFFGMLVNMSVRQRGDRWASNKSLIASLKDRFSKKIKKLKQ